MRTFIGTEEYYVLMLIPFGSKEHGYALRYWAKGRDFTLKAITHATRFDSISSARSVMTKARKRYRECPWFGITDNDEMIIAEVRSKVHIKEVE